MMLKLKAFILLIMTIQAEAQHTDKAQDMDIYQKKIHLFQGDTLPYRIMYPADFDENSKYPLLLFLHGAGERGRDNETQLVHGGSLFADPSNREDFPAVVVFPQCAEDDWWARTDQSLDPGGKRIFTFHSKGPPTPSMQGVLDLLDELLSLPYINHDRVYLGGLSMGGMGTFDLLSLRPGIFAAAFPICGGGDPGTARKISRVTAVWIFHGAADDVVDPEYSETMAAALKKHKGEVKLTIYPGTGHNSWDHAFAEKDLLPWVFSHRR
jgi:predicted peptidase